MYSRADYIVNVKKAATLNFCWKKLQPEDGNDFWGFPNQEDKKNILMLQHKVPGGLTYLEADVQEVISQLLS